jgi:hypothetical protein
MFFSKTLFAILTNIPRQCQNWFSSKYHWKQCYVVQSNATVDSRTQTSDNIVSTANFPILQEHLLLLWRQFLAQIEHNTFCPFPVTL